MKTQAFTPTLTGPYYMKLVLNGITVWTEPDNGLTVNSAPTFAVTGYSFNPPTITPGQSSTGTVSVSGGTAGTYTLTFWQDVSLGFDTKIGSYTFTHNGTSTTLSRSINPTVAGTYHMSVEFATSTMGIQPNDTSRLKVTTPPPNVKIENVDISRSVMVGQVYYYNVTLKNSTSTQVTVTLNIDSSLTGNEYTTSISLTTNTSQKIPITTAFISPGDRTLTYTVLYDYQTLDVMKINVKASAVISSTVQSWRQNIQPGDILLTRSEGYFAAGISLTGDFWTHAGIYVGNETVIEATGSGVTKTKITDWDYPLKTCVGLFRVRGTDDTAIRNVLNFVQQQVTKPYWLHLDKSSSTDSLNWYCSELDWAAYMQVGINIENTPDEWMVSPQEIGSSENVFQVGLHIEKIPTLFFSGSNYFTVELHSPADLFVTDPNGLIVSTKTIQVPGALYFVDDFDNNGHAEAIVYIPNAINGAYEVKVIPKDSALATDKYSVQTEEGGKSNWLAKDALISSIPSQGYTMMIGVPPSLTTENATDVSSDSARLIGNLSSLGSSSSVRVSFQWRTGSVGYFTEMVGQTKNEIGNFTSNVVALLPNTTYYFRAKIEIIFTSGEVDKYLPFASYTFYGEEKSFTTSSISPNKTSTPLVTDTAITPYTSITPTVAHTTTASTSTPNTPFASNSPATPSKTESGTNEGILVYVWILPAIGVILVVGVVLGTLIFRKKRKENRH